MKYCPSCKTTYADESLRFCLQDGTGLRNYPEHTPAPTVDWTEKETVVRQVPVTSGWEQPIRSTQDGSAQPEAKKSNTILAVLLTALAMCVVFGVIGVGWALLGGKNSDNRGSANSVAGNARNAASQTTTPVINDKRNNKVIATPDDRSIWLPTDYNASLDGERLTYYRGTTVEACRADCEVNAKCAGFGLVRAGHYNPSDPPMCYLLSKVTNSTKSDCCISAIKKK